MKRMKSSFLVTRRPRQWFGSNRIPCFAVVGLKEVADSLDELIGLTSLSPRNDGVETTVNQSRHFPSRFDRRANEVGAPMAQAREANANQVNDWRKQYPEADLT